MSYYSRPYYDPVNDSQSQDWEDNIPSGNRHMGSIGPDGYSINPGATTGSEIPAILSHSDPTQGYSYSHSSIAAPEEDTWHDDEPENDDRATCGFEVVDLSFRNAMSSYQRDNPADQTSRDNLDNSQSIQWHGNLDDPELNIRDANEGIWNDYWRASYNPKLPYYARTNPRDEHQGGDNSGGPATDPLLYQDLDAPGLSTAPAASSQHESGKKKKNKKSKKKGARDDGPDEEDQSLGSSRRGGGGRGGGAAMV